MADEIQVVAAAGDTLYFHVRTMAGLVWYPGGPAFEAYGTAGRDSDDYDIALVDKSVGLYVGDFPSAIPTADEYVIIVLKQLGANPADIDLVLGSESIVWDGVGVPGLLSQQIAFAFLANNVSQNNDTGTITVFAGDGIATLATYTYIETASTLDRAVA